MRNLKRALSLALASVMLMGMMVVGTSAASFPDVDDNDNIEAIDVLETVDVMIGNENGDFEPDKNVTRAEMAVVMAKLLNLDYNYYVTSCPFNDVPEWARGYVGACAANGIVSGRGEGVYDPNATVTAVEAASMMMRALGYFQNSEDYKGGFEAATVKQASQISLFNGIGGNAKDPMNRNQVAKLALNALEANMVYFTGDVGFEMPGVGNVGYRSEYTIRTGSESKYAALSDLGDTVSVGGNRGQYYVQLGEELYDGKLTKRSGTAYPDDFGRPATTWRYDGKDIGTYANEADLTYTKSVKVGDIYKDLGLGDTVKAENVTVYVDGVEDDNQPARAIRKGDTSNSYGGNGVLTEVFYLKSNRSDEANRIVITEVNTYVGEVSKTVAATDKKDAYVVIATDGDSRPAGVSGSLNFETDAAFDDDVRVLYTYSLESEEVKSLAVAETLSGEATRVHNKATDEDERKAIYIEDTAYNFSAKDAGVELGQVSVGNSYDLYLDKYGYVIYIDEIDEIGDYALVLSAQDKGDFSSNRALLVFSDGTEKVVPTDKNYKVGGGNKNAIAPGTIVTYREDDGVYTLKPVKKTVGTNTIASGTPTFSVDGTDDKFEMKNDKAGVKITQAAGNTQPYYVFEESDTAKSADEKKSTADDPAVTVNANSSTIFVVSNLEDGDYAAYTGIKNVPSIKAETGDVNVYTYCKSGTMARVMFIFVEKSADIKDSSKSMIFLAGNSVSDLIHTKQGDYYEYNAVVNDEITTVMVDEDLGKNLNGLYASYTIDKNDIITNVSKFTAFDNTTDAKQALDGGIGIDKRNADYTVIMGAVGGNGDYTVTVDDAAKIYAVDEDGEITVSSYRAISKDDDDKVYAVVQDWLVKHLFIETVSPSDDAAVPVVTIAPAGAKTVSVGDTLELTANASVARGDLTYQWYKHTTGNLTLANISSATKLAGKTGEALTVTGEKEGDEFYYYCVVTNTDDKASGDSTAKKLAVSGKITTGKAYSGVAGVRVTYKEGGDKVGAQSIAVPVDVAGFGELTADMLKVPEFYKFAANALDGFPKEVDKATSSTLAVDVAVVLDKKNNVPKTFTSEDLTALVANTEFEGVEAVISTDLEYTVGDDGEITYKAAEMKAFKKGVTEENAEVLKALNTFWFGNERKDEWKTTVSDILETMDNYYTGGAKHTAFIAVYVEDQLSIIPVRGDTPTNSYTLSGNGLRGSYTIDFSALTWPRGF